MKCKKCQSLIFEYLDESLPEKKAGALERHLRDCERCSDFYSQEISLSSFLGNSMNEMASSLQVHPETVEGIKRQTKKLKGHRERIRFIIRPATAIALFCVVLVTIWIIGYLKSGSDKNIEAQNRADFSSANLLFSDSLDEWHERSLVITIRDKNGEIKKHIVTSNEKEVILYPKNNGG